MKDTLNKKINLEETPTEEASLQSKKRFKLKFRFKPRFSKKIVFSVVGILAVLSVFLFFFLFLPLWKIKGDLPPLIASGQKVSAAIQTQDLNQAVTNIEETSQGLDKMAKDYRRLGWFRFIPFFGNYYRDGQHLIRGGDYLLQAAKVGIEGLQPYADILGLEGEEKKTMEEMTVEERLLLVLDTVDKLQPSLDEIGEKLELAREEIDQIDPGRYPQTLFGKKIRVNVIVLINAIDGAAEIALKAKPVISYLKPLLGVPDEKRYLLLFQNDTELRPTGGFITAYAEMSVHNGKITPLGSHDIYSLDAKFGNRVKAPEPILNYHKNVFYWHLRDMNLSPDFAQSMETFWEHFQKVGPKEIDAIIAVDTNVLVDLLENLGQIGVPGWGNFSSEIDERCDCPQVVYELELLADKPVSEWRTERKAVLGPLMHSILANAMGSPRKKWPEFFNITLAAIQEKHLLFYFLDEELQQAMEALNAAGRIKEAEGDYFHLNDCNFAGAKSDMFIERSVKQEIEIASDGTVTKMVTIDYRNPAPPSNCNLEAGELCLNGLYRDWVRLYVPQGSELIEATGAEIETKVYEDLGKTVFETFYGDQAPLRPEGKKQLTFKYKLPFKLEKGEDYQLLIQKQPGTYNPEYEIILDSQQEIFELTTDRHLQFSR
ncbi:DUF4012 domain-containing protein [Patescibacteria group bacterium]|nr:DUF4012 domain-containing protein [Patescibacteria group bacterium]